jgi:hypothetical protein
MQNCSFSFEFDIKLVKLFQKTKKRYHHHHCHHYYYYTATTSSICDIFTIASNKKILIKLDLRVTSSGI